jgi:Mg-chelatase subunit ChlD
MNSDFSQLPPEERALRFTALLLGELSADEAESIHQALAVNPELAREYERLKHTIELVRETTAMQHKVSVAGTPLRLDDSRRAKLLETFKQPAPRAAAPRRRRWFVPASIAAVLVGLLVLALSLPMFVRARAGAKRLSLATRMNGADSGRALDRSIFESHQIPTDEYVDENRSRMVSAGAAIPTPTPARSRTVTVLPSLTDADGEGTVTLHISDAAATAPNAGWNSFDSVPANPRPPVASKTEGTRESGRASTMTVPEVNYQVADLDAIQPTSRPSRNSVGRDLYLGTEPILGESTEARALNSPVVNESPVYSVNAVGYVNKSLTDDYQLIANPSGNKAGEAAPLGVNAPAAVLAPPAESAPEAKLAQQAASNVQLGASTFGDSAARGMGSGRLGGGVGGSFGGEQRAFTAGGGSSYAGVSIAPGRQVGGGSTPPATAAPNPASTAPGQSAQFQFGLTPNSPVRDDGAVEFYNGTVARPAQPAGGLNSQNTWEASDRNRDSAWGNNDHVANGAARDPDWINFNSSTFDTVPGGAPDPTSLYRFRLLQNEATAASPAGGKPVADASGPAVLATDFDVDGLNLEAKKVADGRAQFAAGNSVGPDSAPLESRFYRVDANALESGLKNVTSDTFGQTAPVSGRGGFGRGGGRSGARGPAAQPPTSVDNYAYGAIPAPEAKPPASLGSFFNAAGVDFNGAGKSVEYDQKLGGLAVRGTASDLEIVDKALGVLTMPESQLIIGAKFMNVEQDVARANGSSAPVIQDVELKERGEQAGELTVAEQLKKSPSVKVAQEDEKTRELAGVRGFNPFIGSNYAAAPAKSEPGNGRFDVVLPGQPEDQLSRQSSPTLTREEAESRIEAQRRGVATSAPATPVPMKAKESELAQVAKADRQGFTATYSAGVATNGVIAPAPGAEAKLQEILVADSANLMATNAVGLSSGREFVTANYSDSTFAGQLSEDVAQLRFQRDKLAQGIDGMAVELNTPAAGTVQIIETAEPEAQQRPSLWGRIAGTFGGDVQRKAVLSVEQDVVDVDPMSVNLMLRPPVDAFSVATEKEKIQSKVVLGRVVKALKLNEAWAEKRGAEPLSDEAAIALLKKKLDVQPVRNTSLLEIRAKGENGEEAARLANAVAEAFKETRTSARTLVKSNALVNLKQQLAERDSNLARATEQLAEKRRTPNEDKPAPKPPPGAPTPQPEVLTRDNAFSTFSLNVSDVSFKLAAASLEKGAMPDVAGIRSEEFLNAFDYRDPMPAAGVPIAFAWERARYPFAHNRDALRFSVKTAAQGRDGGRPLNIVLLLDNSGSMERADRVRIIQESLRTLADQLQPQDKLSVVSFSRTATLRADGVNGAKALELAKQIGALTPEGGTNLEDAMDLAYRTALKHYAATAINRVVLLTDGAANLGNVEPKALKAKVEGFRKQGVALDCFGIGWDGLNDDLLEQLSRNGDGRYGYINAPEEAATEFAGQLAGALRVAASDVKVQIEFNPKRVTAYRQVGYAKHQLTKQQFRDNTVDAAEIGASEAGNGLYIIETNPRGGGPIATVRARFRTPQTSDYREHEWVVPYGSAVDVEQSSSAMRLATSASAFSEWLASSPFSGEVTTTRLLQMMSGVPEVFGADPRPKKLEWMIRQAKSISGK